MTFRENYYTESAEAELKELNPFNAPTNLKIRGIKASVYALLEIASALRSVADAIHDSNLRNSRYNY